TKLRGDFLFSAILLWTSAFIPCAMIVDIPLLFHFCDEGTTTVPTRDQSLERPGVFLLTCTTLPFVREHHLYTVKKVLCNERFMETMIMLPGPDKIPIINGIDQEGVNATAGNLDARA